MMSLNPQISRNGSIYPAGMTLLGAVLLIMLGLGFEAIQFGWAHLLPHGVWLFSVILPGLWNMLAVQWNDPTWRELVKIAPLALIAAGTLILLGQRRMQVREREDAPRAGGSLDA